MAMHRNKVEERERSRHSISTADNHHGIDLINVVTMQNRASRSCMQPEGFNFLMLFHSHDL